MTAKVVVRASIAPMHIESRVSSPQTSQRLAGHTVEVLEIAGDWLRVRGEDGYDGWMHRGYVLGDGDERPSQATRRTLSSWSMNPCPRSWIRTSPRPASRS